MAENEGLQIPIGADLADLQAAFQQIHGHVVRMGNRINGSLGQANGAFSRTARAASVIRTALSRVWQSVRSGAAAAFRGMVSAARAGAAAVRRAFSGVMSLASRAGRMFGAVASAVLPIGGILSLAGAVGLAMGAVNKAAEMESLETAFAPLLDGADAAKARIAELSRFAAATPFELPEVAQASRVLEVLTRGALATGDGLRLVGDVAAATQQPFQEIAMWIGRLYDGLQSGRPVGEAMMRLQELGAISGDVRGRIEALQKSGAAGPQIWNEAAAALNRFGGSMERQSRTWAGKLSTMRDNLNLLMAEIGKPIIDGLKPFLDMAIAKIETMRKGAKKFGEAIGRGLNILLAAFQTGRLGELLSTSLHLAMVNGINVLAAGISATVALFADGMASVMGGIGKSLRDSGISGTLEAIFMGIGNLLSARLRDAAADFLSGIGKVRAARQMRDVAAADQLRGENYLHMAKAGIASLDLASAISGVGEAIMAGKNEFVSNYQKALASPLIDPTLIREKFGKTIDELNEQVRENLSKQDAANRALDSRLRNNAPAAGPAAAIDKVARGQAPAVMSLARIGGGGFASSQMGALVVEGRRQTSLLQRIARNTIPGTSKLTAVYA